MKQAIKVINEIKRLCIACNKTNSRYLITDYTKQIKALKKDLREYCGYKGYSYNALCKEYKI